MSIQTDLKVITVAPSLTTFVAPYATGKQLGAALKLADATANSGGTARIESLVLIDNAKAKVSIDVYFFNQLPSLVGTDGADFDVTDANMLAQCRGVINIPAANYHDSASNSVATVSNQELLVPTIPKSKDLWCVLVSRGAPTYGALTDLKLAVGIIQ